MDRNLIDFLALTVPSRLNPKSRNIAFYGTVAELREYMQSRTSGSFDIVHKNTVRYGTDIYIATTNGGALCGKDIKACIVYPKYLY